MKDGQTRSYVKTLRALVKSGALGIEQADALTVHLVNDEGEKFDLPKSALDHFIALDIIFLENGSVRPGQKIRSWLRRELSGAESEREAAESDDETGDFTAGSPAALPDGVAPAFYAPHQLVAGERYAKLVERAMLRQRTTMSYQPSPVGGQRNVANDIPDMAVDARQQLNRIHAHLPKDCAGVLFDVCAYRKGLQQIETERGWPRRSAKLVLRIGFEELARHFGLSNQATGRTGVAQQGWMDDGAKPMQFG